jgi:hypothetical protein
MKKIFSGLMLVFILGSFTAENTIFPQTDDGVYRTVENRSFRLGEEVKYRVHYGFINAGEATVEVSPDLFRVNNRPCFRITVSGSSSNVFDKFLKIRDTWRSYVDTSAIVSQRFYWNIQEGKYKKEETVFFDHPNKKIRSEEKNQEAKDFENIAENLQDLVSGYYYLRTVDFSQMKENDMVSVKGFFDDNFFDFKVRFRGRETIKTKFGKIRCLRLTPVMPKNDLFDGDSSIRFYVSDDENKIPVKVQADMFVGAVEVEIKDYKNLKYPLNFN